MDKRRKTFLKARCRGLGGRRREEREGGKEGKEGEVCSEERGRCRRVEGMRRKEENVDEGKEDAHRVEECVEDVCVEGGEPSGEGEGSESVRPDYLPQSVTVDGGTHSRSRIQTTTEGGVGTAWAGGFVPRLSLERTRNCSQIDQSLCEEIVATVARALLETENWVELGTSHTHTPTHIPNHTHTLTTYTRTGQSSSSGSDDGRSGDRGKEGMKDKGTATSFSVRQWNRGGNGV